jgi:hypothetical protein
VKTGTPARGAADKNKGGQAFWETKNEGFFGVSDDEWSRNALEIISSRHKAIKSHWAKRKGDCSVIFSN